jgi:hypothetical protein
MHVHFNCMMHCLVHNITDIRTRISGHSDRRHACAPQLSAAVGRSGQASELGSSAQVAESWRATATCMRTAAAMDPPQKVKVGTHRHQRGGISNRSTMGVRRAAWHMAGSAFHWLRPSVLDNITVQALHKSIVQWLKPLTTQAEVDLRAPSRGFHDVDPIDQQVPSARLNWTYTNLYDNTAPAIGSDASASNSEQSTQHRFRSRSPRLQSDGIQAQHHFNPDELQAMYGIGSRMMTTMGWHIGETLGRAPHGAVFTRPNVAKVMSLGCGVFADIGRTSPHWSVVSCRKKAYQTVEEICTPFTAKADAYGGQTATGIIHVWARVNESRHEVACNGSSVAALYYILVNALSELGRQQRWRVTSSKYQGSSATSMGPSTRLGGL